MFGKNVLANALVPKKVFSKNSLLYSFGFKRIWGKEMEKLTEKIFSMLFYSLVSILLTALFIVTLTQGAMIQITFGDSARAFLHYLSAVMSLVAAYIVYKRAKKMLAIISLIE